MKTEIIIYRILSFLLLPVAVLFGVLCLAALPVALSFPPALFSLFLLACFVIYVIAASVFLNKGIAAGRACKPVLRDWIRINGIITLIYFLLTTISFILLKSHPELLEKSLRQWSGSSYLPAGTNEKDLRNTMMATANVFIGLGAIIIVHVIITFRLMKQYRRVFEPDRTDIEEQ